MFSLFLMFNRIVLEIFTAALIMVLSIFPIKLVGGLSIAVLIILFATIFTSAPFVPTRKKIFQKMFEFADIKPGDKVYDLGCGEGRFIFEAEKRGAHAVGIEMNIGVYLLALFNKRRLGSQSTIIRGNLHQVDLKDADVMFCYLMPWAMKKLDHKFRKELKKGCKIISHSFKLPGWEIDKQYNDGGIMSHSVFLHIV